MTFWGAHPLYLNQFQLLFYYGLKPTPTVKYMQHETLPYTLTGNMLLLNSVFFLFP